MIWRRYYLFSWTRWTRVRYFRHLIWIWSSRNRSWPLILIGTRLPVWGFPCRILPEHFSWPWVSNGWVTTSWMENSTRYFPSWSVKIETNRVTWKEYTCGITMATWFIWIIWSQRPKVPCRHSYIVMTVSCRQPFLPVWQRAWLFLKDWKRWIVLPMRYWAMTLKPRYLEHPRTSWKVLPVWCSPSCWRWYLFIWYLLRSSKVSVIR